jgi:hypothetical protein
MRWDVKKLECVPRGYRDFGYSGLKCWGYDEDGYKFNVGPPGKKSGLSKFYSIQLDVSGADRITTSDDLRLFIEFDEPRECNFEMHGGKRVRGSLIC